MPKPSANKPRGSVKKDASTIVALWVPDELLAALDSAVVRQDTDRSKLIRQAIRKQLLRSAS
jgi:metal-responsive CopG/Arc/MetJ family transcriptional regulator